MGEAPSHPTPEPLDGSRRWTMPDAPPTFGDVPAWASPSQAPAVPAAPVGPPTTAYPPQFLPQQYHAPTYPAPPAYAAPPAYPTPPAAPRTGYPTIPPTVPPGRPPTWPPYGAQPQPAPEAPRRRPALAGVALIALIAVVLGLTAGVTIDRALIDREQRADAESPFSRPDPTDEATDPSTNAPAGGGLVDPSQGGNEPSVNGAACTTSAPTAEESADIAAKVTPGVVNINTMLGYQSAAAAGTGMILSEDGLVLTNNHVIDSSTIIKATVVGTGKTYDAKVLGTAAELDVALIQLVDASDLPTVKIDTKNVATCDPIVAAGNAGGKGGDPSVVSGIVTALDRSITASDENGNNQETLHELIETNAPIQPGDSGGPLIDADGEVIGMNTAASAANQFQSVKSVGYAIPIANALEIVEQIKAGEEDDTVRIGLPGIMGVQLDSRASTALVLDAAAGLPAAEAGITAGSTIVSINGTAVETADAVGEVLNRAKPGDEVEVSWVDASGQQHTETLTLVEGPSN